MINFIKHLLKKLFPSDDHTTEAGIAGAIHAEPDERNILASEIAGFNEYAWRDSMTKKPTTIKNQGMRPSCGGNAAAAVTEIFAGEEQSADFIYNPIAYIGGGTTQQDLAKSLCTRGSVPEQAYPSLETDTQPLLVPDDVKAKGAKFKKFLTVWSPDFSWDTLAQMNDKFGHVIITIKGQNNGTWRNAFPMPTDDKNPNKAWYHFMKVFDAYKDSTKNLVVQQSWGKDVGRNGVQVLREGHIITSAFSVVPRTQGDKIVHTFDKDLNFGDKSFDVYMLQNVLWGEGCFPVDPTSVAGYDYATSSGEYGNMTALAVREYLRKKKLISDAAIKRNGGKFVGPIIRKSLNLL